MEMIQKFNQLNFKQKNLMGSSSSQDMKEPRKRPQTSHPHNKAQSITGIESAFTQSNINSNQNQVLSPPSFSSARRFSTQSSVSKSFMNGCRSKQTDKGSNSFLQTQQITLLSRQRSQVESTTKTARKDVTVKATILKTASMVKSLTKGDQSVIKHKLSPDPAGRRKFIQSNLN